MLNYNECRYWLHTTVVLLTDINKWCNSYTAREALRSLSLCIFFIFVISSAICIILFGYKTYLALFLDTINV